MVLCNQLFIIVKQKLLNIFFQANQAFKGYLNYIK